MARTGLLSLVKLAALLLVSSNAARIAKQHGARRVAVPLSGGAGHRMTMAGHRGSSYTAPENTLAANRLAFEQGADGVEFDVLRSLDGEIFLNHDYTLAKTGNPVCPPELCAQGGMTQSEYSNKLTQQASSLSYRDFIRYVDVGSWKSPEYAGERPPTLRQAMAEIPDGKYALVELKGSDAELGRMAVDMAIAEGWPVSKYWIIGFSLDLMTQVKQDFLANGKEHTVWFVKSVSSESAAQDAVRTARSRNLDGVDLLSSGTAITRSVVRLAQEEGERVGVWVSSRYSNIDTPQNAGLMESREVDFFTSDFPPVIQEWVASRGQEVRCKEGDRIVGQWGGNGLWYSGIIKSVRSPTNCDILGDDDNSGSDWQNVWPTRVLQSSDDGSQPKWCWRASDVNSVPDTFDVSMCTQFTLPEVKCGQGDRIVGQWGGNGKWYSGVILSVHSATSADILADDENLGEGWQNVDPSRVLKSSDDGSRSEWCWRAGDIAAVPRTYETRMCTEFSLPPALPPVTCKAGDRIVGQWGGNGKWYSGIIANVRSATSADILGDDGNSGSGWQNVRPTRVLKSSDDGSQPRWCWQAGNIASIPNTFAVSDCTEFAA